MEAQTALGTIDAVWYCLICEDTFKETEVDAHLLGKRHKVMIPGLALRCGKDYNRCAAPANTPVWIPCRAIHSAQWDDVDGALLGYCGVCKAESNGTQPKLTPEHMANKSHIANFKVFMASPKARGFKQLLDDPNTTREKRVDLFKMM